MPTIQELEAELKALRATVAAAKQPAHVTFKVSAKGALSVYGLGRFPVTLYRGQWERLIAVTGELTEALKSEGLVDKTA